MNEKTLYRALIIRPLVIAAAALLTFGVYRCATYKTRTDQQPVQISVEQEPIKESDRSAIDESSLSRIVRYGLDEEEKSLIELTKKECEKKNMGRLVKIHLTYKEHEKNIDLYADPVDGEKYIGAVRREIEDSQNFFACDLLPKADVEIVVPRTREEIYSSRLPQFDFDQRIRVYLVPDIRHKFVVESDILTDKRIVASSPGTMFISEFLDPRIDYTIVQTDIRNTVRQVRGGMICSTRVMGRKDNEAAVIQAPVACVLISQLSPIVGSSISDEIESGVDAKIAKQKHTTRSERLAFILTGGWFAQKYGKKIPEDQIGDYVLFGFEPAVKSESQVFRERLKTGDRTAVRELVERFRDDPSYLAE